MAYQNLRDRYTNDGAGVASQPRLLIMLFDRLVTDVRTSLQALSNNDIETVNTKLCNAQAILLELHAALDLKAWPQGESLAQLYLWLSNELVTANLKKDGRRMQTCLRMIEQLCEAWHGAYEQTQAANVAPITSSTAVAPV